MDDFIWIQKWFAKQCDGDWEHSHGIKIGTLDNPGWYISISLKETELETKNFEYLVVERSEQDWFHCFILDGRFEGPCGLYNLTEVLNVFRTWAEKSQQ